MKWRGDRVFRDVHTLATVYHWSRAEILSLPLLSRLRHLMLIEAERDADLLHVLHGEQA